MRSSRSIVAGVALVALLLPADLAVADDPLPSASAATATPSEPTVVPSEPAAAESAGSPVPTESDASAQPEAAADVLADLPVDAVDVTGSDTSLRDTTNEITVMVTGSDGEPTIRKLRADSSADAAALAEHLDAEPGVVAAPTSRLRSFGVNTEPMAAQQWNLEMVGGPAAWDTTQGAGVTVAVIDTGVNGTHGDLAGRVLPEIDLLPAVAPAAADNTHGTRVASLIAGNLNGIGMAGVAPLVNILPVAALDPSGIGDSSTVAQAIIAAADAGARVINLSLGGPDRDPVLDQAALYAYNKGSILVAAAGNSYQTGNQIQYPAASPNVVAVASVDASGNPSAFSNTGPHIALAAPGENVLAATTPNDGFSPDGYDLQSGTSFATPHVAAALALVAAANPSLSAAQIVQVTELTAQDDVSGNGRDTQLGYGIVRPDRAVATALLVQAAALPAGTRLRLRSFNALPEPNRRGAVTTLRVRVQARYPDGVWRSDPLPAQVRIEFKPSGSRRYRAIGEVASAADGTAILYSVPARSGTWRAKVRQAGGKWTVSGGTDFLRVRR